MTDAINAFYKPHFIVQYLCLYYYICSFRLVNAKRVNTKSLFTNGEEHTDGALCASLKVQYAHFTRHVKCYLCACVPLNTAEL